MLNKTLLASGTAALLLLANPALAATTFIGSDDGAAVGGPWVSSSLAQASFLAAAASFGTVQTEDFESVALGFTPVTAITGGTITTGSPSFGPGFSGVSNTTLGSIYGFNTTAGGERWYGAPNNGPASMTIAFANPTNSVGFFLTGVQSVFTSGITLTQLDGSALVFNLPVNVNGGVNYFGVVDSTAFTSVTLTFAGGGDAWGIDDIASNGAIPEPGTWAMLITGFGLVGAMARRRRGIAAA